MSLTKASYSMISGAPINVIDYGAVGDNTTNDTAAIQAAIDAMTNGSTLVFAPGKTYRVTAAIVVPPSLTGCVFYGNGSTIRADHNGDGLVMTATNENFSRHKVYDLTIKGPNVSYPNNPSELAGTSTGAALKIGRDDTSNTTAGYLTSFYNCTFSNFNKGIYLQATILVNFYGGYISFNQFGVYVDSGATNANTFYGVGIRENRQFGIYSSPRTGGALTFSTHNVFHSCEIETNIPYDASAGGYPSTFDPNTGLGVKIWNTYDWVFDSCYFENHNYSVVIETSSDDNRFNSCRFDGGGVGGVRQGGILIAGPDCNNNVFNDCKMNDYVGYTAGTFQVGSSTNNFNQLINCIGFSFNPGNILNWPYIQNLRKAQGTAGSGQPFGTIQMPLQGYKEDPAEGTAPGSITGVGTATATLNCLGYGEFQFGASITGNTTITTISGQRPGQFLVLRNYQTARTVTLKAAASGTGDIVLTGNADVVFNAFGQQLVLYVTSGLGGNKCYEVGRNF